MMIPVAVTLAFLPLYLLVRAPFFRLPLHIDTGFYVSNATVATGRWRFSRGWNARLAGCSKVIPEAIYSLVYLWIARPRGGGPAYKFASRLAASLYNYLAAIAVGFVASQLGGGDTVLYCAGLILYGLISSEPQYGVYFENGELFGVLWNVAAVALLIHGLATGSAWPIALGVFVWACDAFFIKLSSGVALAVVVAGLSIVHPADAPAMLAGGLTAAGLYVAWILFNGKNPRALIASLIGHETALGQRPDWRIVGGRVVEKTRCLARTFARQPLIPSLALIAVVIRPPDAALLMGLWMLGVVAVYVLQAADCWYYQIPFLPILAILAAPAVAMLLSGGWPGAAVLAGLLIVWLYHNPARARRLDADALSAWCWRGYRPMHDVSANAALEAIARDVRPEVGGSTLLVYGPCTQAYVLLGASYDTPIVTPESYLDEMCPGWQAELNCRLVDDPPRFVLDTADSFAADAARTSLGLDYRIQKEWPGRFRLFVLDRVTDDRGAPDDVRTFAPQSQAELRRERELGRDRLTQASAHSIGAPGSACRSEESSALAQVLRSLYEAGHRRVAVYGAGRYTLRNRHVYERADVTVAVVLDDDPNRCGSTLLDWPVRRPEQIDATDIDAVVISTDRFVGRLTARARRLWRDRLPIVSVVHTQSTAAV